MQYRSTLFNRDIPAALLLVAVAAIWITRANTPAVQSVNGTYRNSCCNPVVLKDGTLITETAHIPFKLALMKYGLEADLTKGIEVVGGKVVPSARPGFDSLVFDDQRTGFVVCADHCGAGRKHKFTRE